MPAEHFSSGAALGARRRGVVRPSLGRACDPAAQVPARFPRLNRRGEVKLRAGIRTLAERAPVRDLTYKQSHIKMLQSHPSILLSAAPVRRFEPSPARDDSLNLRVRSSSPPCNESP